MLYTRSIIIQRSIVNFYIFENCIVKNINNCTFTLALIHIIHIAEDDVWVKGWFY